MNNKEKSRYMKRIVRFCLIYCAIFPIPVFVAKFFDVDTVDILSLVFGLFGGELLLTLIIKLIGDKNDKKEKEDINND